MNVLITGASGFVGKHLCASLVDSGAKVTGIVRNQNEQLKNVKLLIKDLNTQTHLQDALNGIDVVIHLAGRAHVIKEVSSDPYKAYFEVNLNATKHLAEQAALYGVKRLIFLSSIGVNGNSSQKPFDELDTPNPHELYAISKKKAEDELRRIALSSNLEVVIIRPPLIYGEGAKGNFKKLVNLCERILLLPFGAILNKRSLIYIENLVDFIVLCTLHPKAANETFLISDDNDVSTTQLLKTVIKTGSNKALLIPVPQWIIRFSFKLIGKANIYTKICGDLQVDINKAKSLLNWRPLYGFEEGIKKTMQKNDNVKKNS